MLPGVRHIISIKAETVRGPQEKLHILHRFVKTQDAAFACVSPLVNYGTRNIFPEYGSFTLLPEV